MVNKNWAWFQSGDRTYSVVDKLTKRIVAEGLDKTEAILIAAAPPRPQPEWTVQHLAAIRRALMTVIDDRVWSLHAHPSQRVSNTSWAGEANAQLDAEINEQRLQFADTVCNYITERVKP